MPDTEITIDYARIGRNGAATLTVKHGAKVLAVDKIDTTKRTERNNFAADLCRRFPGIASAEIEDQLLAIAANLQGIQCHEEESTRTPPELDRAAIVRPERLITPEVSGIAIPSFMEIDNRPVGCWRQYLCWANGEREFRPLGRTLDLGDGRQLFIHPHPSEPEVGTAVAWTRQSRDAWLNGSAATDPASLFQNICETIAHFVDVPSEQGPGIVATLTLWIVLTYVYQAWPAVPYLHVGGPLGSGKSRVYEILEGTAFRPLVSSSVTGPALFRTLHNQGGTLLYDEAERLKHTSAPEVGEVNSILLAGYKRGGRAVRLEKVGETFKTVTFDVFGPKALACIATLPAAIASRCIPITMLRAGPDSAKPRRRIDADLARWQLLRDDLHIVAMEHGPMWLELAGRSDVCPTMSGRDYELWQPLLALAWWFESNGVDGLLKLVADHALNTIDRGRDDQTPEVDEILLRLLAAAIRSGDKPRPGEILAQAKSAEPELFRMWTAKGVSVHLKRYRLETNKTCGQKVYGRVSLDALRTIQTNYGMELGFE